MMKQENTGKAQTSGAKDMQLDAKEPAVAGINVGFGWTKIHTATGGQCWPSVAALYRSGLGTQRGPQVDQLVTVDGKRYQIGEAAAKSAHPLKALHRQFFKTVVYRALVAGVVSKLAQQHKSWNLVVGIALNHYMTEGVADAVKAIWLGDNGNHVTPWGTVNMAQVMVVPETLGALNYLMADEVRARRWSSSRAVVIDFGRLTTSWITVLDGECENSSNGIDIGVTALIDTLTEMARLRTGEADLTPTEVELAMLGKRTLYAKPAHLDAIRQPLNMEVLMADATQEVWPLLESAVRASVGSVRGRDLVAVGGGALAFAAQIKSSFTDANVTIDPNAQTANAQGMYAMATQLWPTWR